MGCVARSMNGFSWIPWEAHLLHIVFDKMAEYSWSSSKSILEVIWAFVSQKRKEKVIWAFHFVQVLPNTHFLCHSIWVGIRKKKKKKKNAPCVLDSNQWAMNDNNWVFLITIFEMVNY